MPCKAVLILFFIVLPFLCFGQSGVATYSANVHGKKAKLKLAGSFSGASEIQMGGISYYANSGRPDASDHLMFQSKHIQNLEYFILANIQATYEKFPAYITGKYYRGRNGVSVRFKLNK